MPPKEKKPINIEIGKNIQKYRELAGYTRERFAELIGITPQFLAAVEAGISGVSCTTLKQICEVLGISSDKLLWSHENKIELDERLMHLDPEYHKVIHQILTNQLEVIALTRKFEKEKKPEK